MRRIPIALAFIALTACGAPDGPAAEDESTASETTTAVGTRDVVYVDVRTPAEFAAGHVRGAINIPHTEMPERWRELDVHREDSLVLYCRTGRRSALALDVLHDQGFEHTRNARSLETLLREGVPGS